MQPFLDIGFGNFVFPLQTSIILNPDSQPVIRLIKESKKNNNCFDISQGNKTRAVIVLKTGKIILSAVNSKTIKNRYLEYIDKVNQGNSFIYINPFLEIGFENYVLPENVEVILNPNSQPTVRLVKNAKNNNNCFDIRQGKKTRAVIVLKTGEIVLSAIEAKTIRNRFLKYVNKINGI